MKDDTLKTITITGRKQAIERRTDRTILNVDAFITNAGGTAWDVLERAPGIQTTNDRISLKGRQGITVYIDDKPTYLQGDDLTSYLKSLPAGIVDKIEIMSNPPAHYDAAGNGGIINIRLKKSRIKGFNANVLSENIQGRRSRISQSLNFNLRTNKLNIYGNASNYNGQGLSRSHLYRAYTPGSNSALQSFTQEGSSVIRNDRILIKAGVDWYISPSTTWGLSVSNMHWKAVENRLYSGRQTFTNAAAMDTLAGIDNTIRTATRNNSITLGYQHLYDSAGRKLTADLDYIRYNEHNSSVNKTAITDSDGAAGYREQRNNSQPFNIDIYSAKADYIHPFRKNTQWSAGFKTSYTSAHNTAVYSGTINEADVPAYTVNNRFAYRENITAAYINYAAEWKQWALQAGLRVEHTAIRGEQLDRKTSTDTSFNRKYTNAFPTLYLSYKADKKGNHQLGFSYGRRIDRPGYTSLSPFATPMDKYNYRIGNPYLRPQLSDNFELSWLFRNNFTAAIFYNSLKDGIEETIEVAGDAIYRRPNNVSRKQVMGFTLDGSATITPWWTVNPIIQYTYTQLAAKLNNVDVRVHGDNWHLAPSQQFTLPKGWSIELTPDYTSRLVNAQDVDLPTWYIHAGIGKKVWKENGTIRLNFRDVFYTRRDYQDYSHVKGMTGFNKRTWDTQSITLALSFRIKKGNKSTRALPGEAVEERQRLPGDRQ